jgi:hypothetical protein
MKRYGNLFSKICAFDNLVEAHRNARKGKIHYSEVKMVDANPEKYLTLTRHDQNVIGSYHGWLLWGDTYRLANKYIQPLASKPVIA